VEGRSDILLALEKHLQPTTGYPARPHHEGAEPRLNISVVFTSVESTLPALRKAGGLARSLGAQIVLLVPQVVPYPLPLESPPVLLDWNERRFRVIADGSPVETMVRIYLCRDRLDLLQAVLAPHSIVVIGGRQRLWPTWEKSVARRLRRTGHEVIFTESE
jgi:hypothetical protein